METRPPFQGHTDGVAVNASCASVVSQFEFSATDFCIADYVCGSLLAFKSGGIAQSLASFGLLLQSPIHGMETRFCCGKSASK